MWSSPLELYPVFMPLPVYGQAQVIEPQTAVRAEYLIVQPSREPYALPQEYAKKLWVC